MTDAADRMRAMRRQLVSRVNDALDDVAPELAESAVGRMAQAGVLVELAARLLSDQLGPDIASRMVRDLARLRPRRAKRPLAGRPSQPPGQQPAPSFPRAVSAWRRSCL